MCDSLELFVEAFEIWEDGADGMKIRNDKKAVILRPHKNHHKHDDHDDSSGNNPEVFDGDNEEEPKQLLASLSLVMEEPVQATSGQDAFKMLTAKTDEVTGYVVASGVCVAAFCAIGMALCKKFRKSTDFSQGHADLTTRLLI